MINPNSLANLRPGTNNKNAVRVTLTLKPQTVALLKAQGNMSQAVDKLIQLCILGKVEHDGCLNPVNSAIALSDITETVNTVIEQSIKTDLKVYHPKLDYWERSLTKTQILTSRIATASQLAKLDTGDSFIALDNRRYWKIGINSTNKGLLPLGSRATYLFCCGTDN
jgi:hypothetical protein